jgi:hypothetical protein
MNKTGQTEQKRTIRSRTEQDEQDRTRRAGQDAEQESTGRAGQDSDKDRAGRAQVSRSNDLDFDLVASFESKRNQSGSGLI